jgi:hypothetical protein
MHSLNCSFRVEARAAPPGQRRQGVSDPAGLLASWQEPWVMGLTRAAHPVLS